MKHLIVYAHPNPTSFCHAILETVEQILQDNGDEYVVRDLNEMGFDPVLKASDFAGLLSGNLPKDIKTEQTLVASSDIMTFIYPVWWTGLPAILKGYVDRVFLKGFAYSYGPNGPVPLLGGKRAILLSTQGTPAPYYEQNGMHEAMMKTSDTGIFEFCGIKVDAHQFFEGVPLVDDATRKGYLDDVKATMLGF